MDKKAFLLIILLLCFIPTNAGAVADTSINNHVIIAFDASLNSAKKGLLCSGEPVKSSIQEIIQVHHLLNDSSDYYSFVNFAVGRDIANFKEFAVPSLDKDGDAISWIPFVDFKTMFTQHGRWDQIAYYQGYNRASNQGYGPSSLLSGALQFSLLSVADTRNGKLANRIYIAMVTDNWYAAMNNYKNEFDEFFSNQSNLQKPKFEAYYKPISNQYRFTLIDSVTVKGKYKVFLYEVQPSSNVALSSVVDYPADLGLHRVKGGYRIDFTYQSVDPNYKVERIEVTLKDKGGNIITATSDNNAKVLSKNIIASSRMPYDSVDMTICGWLHQVDTLYGGLLMNPYDAQYPRLDLKFRIPIPDEATVFGFPLLDVFWWWFPDNAKVAALIWEILLVLIFLIILTLIIRKVLLNKALYIPKDSDIKLSKID